MADMGSTVEAYGRTICRIGDENGEVVLLAADVSKAYAIKDFIAKHPGRFFNTGVAEQATVGMAAGLAACGKIPYVHIYTPFLSLRALEQVRDDVCYTKMNVKFVGIVSGINMGIGGSTHQSVEDLAIFRSIPGMTILSPCDEVESAALTEASFHHDGPVFIRLGRYPVPNVYEGNRRFQIGRSVRVREGDDLTIMATGHMVYHSIQAAEMLAKEGVQARVLDFHTIKPLDREAIVDAAEETGAIVTAEEHSVLAGFGGAVAEVAAQECPVPMRMVGINDVFGGVGPTDELMERHGLTADNIAQACREVLKMKKGA